MPSLKRISSSAGRVQVDAVKWVAVDELEAALAAGDERYVPRGDLYAPLFFPACRTRCDEGFRASVAVPASSSSRSDGLNACPDEPPPREEPPAKKAKAAAAVTHGDEEGHGKGGPP